MKSKTGIIVGVGVVIIIAIIVFQINEIGFGPGIGPSGIYPDDYQTVGPLTLAKEKHVLGENVFVWMTLHPLEDGVVSFYTPTGMLYYERSFNGSFNPDPKFYFRPNLEWINDMCSKDNVVGTWKVIITGKTLTEDRKNISDVPKELEFQFVDRVLIGEEHRWENEDGTNKNVCDEQEEREEPLLEIVNPGLNP